MDVFTCENIFLTREILNFKSSCTVYHLFSCCQNDMFHLNFPFFLLFTPRAGQFLHFFRKFPPSEMLSLKTALVYMSGTKKLTLDTNRIFHSLILFLPRTEGKVLI
jgi:hypothetical protein